MNIPQLKRNVIVKSFILLTSLLLIFTSCKMKQESPAQEDVEQIILALERQALDRWSQGDPAGFCNNFADDATYFDDIGAHIRLDSIVEIRNYLASLEGQIPPHNYEIVDSKVQVYGNVAILTMRYHTMFDTVPGPPWKATSVYRLKDDQWQVVHDHWSLVKEQ